jgi:hypothetical protein
MYHRIVVTAELVFICGDKHIFPSANPVVWLFVFRCRAGCKVCGYPGCIKNFKFL